MRRLVSFVLATCLWLLLSTVWVSAKNVDGETVEEVVRSGFYKFSESIDISGFEIKPQELSGLLARVLKDDPYLFFVDGQMSYSYKTGGTVIALKPNYLYCGEEAFLAWDTCRSEVRKIAFEAMALNTQHEKAIFLHDYICLNFDYDETFTNDSIYSFLQTGKGTCQAYTQLYTAVLRECGIESHFVASDTIEHIWNYVKIDEEWYHADLTWDDSSSDKGENGISYRHLLCSDAAAAERGHRDWYSVFDVACVSERFANISCVKEKDESEDKIESEIEVVLSISDLLVLRRGVEYGDVSVYTELMDFDGDGGLTLGDVDLLRKKLLEAD